MKKILVFGGTFNPVHSGHVRLCRLIAEKIGADTVLIVPTFAPVHKAVGSELATSEHRLNMCKLAFDRDGETVCDIEISAGRPCYTYETLGKLEEQYPDAQLYLACGSDMFLTLHTWRNPDVIFDKAVVCAMSRSEQFVELKQYADAYKDAGLRAVLIDAPPMVISSTQIRNMITMGKDVSSLVGDRVAKYIRKHGLYK